MSQAKNLREAVKVLQSYFTNILYSNEKNLDNFIEVIRTNTDIDEVKTFNDLNFSDTVNEIINKACYLVWVNLINSFSTNHPNLNRNLIWNHFFRFYLKGTKTFIKTLEKYENKEENEVENIDNNEISFEVVNKYNNEYDQKNPDYVQMDDKTHFEFVNKPEEISKIISHELKRSIKDSDFDFTFCSNPEDIHNLHLSYVNYIQESLKLAQHYLINNLVNSISLKKFVDVCNLPINQKKLSKMIEKFEKYFTSRDRKTMKFIKSEINKGNFFKFDVDDIELINCDKENPKRTITSLDEFYLFRVVLKMKCISHKLNITFPFFAEIIDISYSIKEDISTKIWKNSTLTNMIYPVNLIDITNNYGYPIANLNYLIDDTIIILQEQDPNKPEKRCEKLLNFIKLNCIEQNLPKLPSEIVIYHKVYDLLITEECSKFLFQDLFKLKENDSVWYTFEINPKFLSLHSFEKWCIEQKLSFDNLYCYNKTKNELVIMCLNYFNHFFKKLIDFYTFLRLKEENQLSEQQKKFLFKQKNNIMSPSIKAYHQKTVENLLPGINKIQLCFWYAELKLIDEIIVYWVNFENVQANFFKHEIFKQDTETNINDQIVEVIETILNYFINCENKIKITNIQLLLKPLSDKNTFADFICKFNINQP